MTTPKLRRRLERSSRKPVQFVSADMTVQAKRCGTLFIVNGGTGVTFTLPAPETSLAGFWFEFYNANLDQTMTVSAGAGNMVGPNNASRASVALQDTNLQACGGFRVVCDGTQWLVGCMLTETSQTVTYA